VKREAVEVERVPTGIVGVDWVLGGGFPRGKIVEIFGFEGSAKSTLLAETVKAFQEAGHLTVYLDYEHAVDLSWFKKIGVELENDGLWLFDQPFSLESGTDAALALVATGKVGLLVIDSVAAMAPQAELDGSMEDATVALQARLMGKFLRKLAGVLSKTGTCAVFVNQLRDRIGWDAKYKPTVTPAGRALKFYAKIRAEMKRVGEPKTTGEKETGSLHRMTLRKQHLGPVQSATTEFEVGPMGIDRAAHLSRCLLDVGLVTKRGENYTFVADDVTCGDETAYRNWVAEHSSELAASYREKMQA